MSERDPIRHEQVTVSLGDESADVDAGLADLILACWAAGLRTVSSCENLDDEGRGFVTFTTEEDAEAFAGRAGAILARTGGGLGLRYDSDEELEAALQPGGPPTYRLVRVEAGEGADGHYAAGEGVLWSVSFPADDVAEAAVTAIRRSLEERPPTD